MNRQTWSLFTVENFKDLCSTHKKYLSMSILNSIRFCGTVHQIQTDLKSLNSYNGAVRQTRSKPMMANFIVLQNGNIIWDGYTSGWTDKKQLTLLYRQTLSTSKLNLNLKLLEYLLTTNECFLQSYKMMRYDKQIYLICWHWALVLLLNRQDPVICADYHIYRVSSQLQLQNTAYWWFSSRL